MLHVCLFDSLYARAREPCYSLDGLLFFVVVVVLYILTTLFGVCDASLAWGCTVLVVVVLALQTAGHQVVGALISLEKREIK